MSVFRFVFANHLRFYPAADIDHFLHGHGIKFQHLAAFIRQQLKVTAVPNNTVLDHLGHAVDVFLLRQGAQDFRVDKDCQGLVKGADQILALREVHPGFAADGGVHLGQQAGRYLDKGDAAHIGRRHETGHIATDAAAQRDEHRFTIHPASGGLTQQLRDRREVFVFLAVGKTEQICLQALFFKRSQKFAAVESCHRIIGDDAVAAGRVISGQLTGNPIQTICLYGYRVTSLAKSDLQFVH